MADEFKPPPFNYCDYRCERCPEQENCRVYKDNEERILAHYLKGEDPNDPKVFLDDLHKIFEKTKGMFKEMATKKGVNIEDLPDEEAPEVNPDDYVIYRLAYEYFKEAKTLIKELERTGTPETIIEDWQDLVWYHTLLVAKTGRLVSGLVDDFDEDLQKIEEQGTLQVINKGIILSREALNNMLNELPDHFYSIVDLLELLNRLEKQLKNDIYQKVNKL